MIHPKPVLSPIPPLDRAYPILAFLSSFCNLPQNFLSPTSHLVFFFSAKPMLDPIRDHAAIHRAYAGSLNMKSKLYCHFCFRSSRPSRTSGSPRGTRTSRGKRPPRGTRCGRSPRGVACTT